MRCQLTMVGVVDAGKRGDPRLMGRAQGPRDMIFLKFGNRGQGCDLVADAFDWEFYDLQSRYGAQKPVDTFHNAGRARILMQSDFLGDGGSHERPEVIQPRCQEIREHIDIDGRLRPGHQGFAELNVAGGAPGQNLSRTRFDKSMHCLARLPAGVGIVARAQLQDPAAIGRATINFITDLKPIQDIQTDKANVWGLQHVASRVEDHVRRVPAGRMGTGAQPFHDIGGHLQSGDHFDATTHGLKRRFPCILAVGQIITT